VSQSPPPEQDAAPELELLHATPGDLITTANVREDLRLDQAFLDSVAALGVLVPIVATRTDDGQLAIVHGHRRAAAAAQVGLTRVAVVVQPPATSDALRLMAQMTENDRRQALSTAETVAAHEQLSLLGVSVAEAARTLGTDATAVRAARQVATKPVARHAAEEAGLDLADALVLAEFGDDSEFVSQLVEEATRYGRDSMLRTAERRRQEIATQEAITATEQQWQEAGYAVVDPDTTATVLWRITDDAGEDLDDDAHAECPGRAVKIHGWAPDRINVTHYCVDAEHHHPGRVAELRSSVREREQDPQEKAARRARTIANNKEWRAAETVRREHVRTWLTKAKLTPQISRWLLSEVLDPGPARSPDQIRQALTELGWASDAFRAAKTGTYYVHETLQAQPNASQQRAGVGLLAWMLAAREGATSTESWRTVQASTATYLEFLQEHTGYTLGHVEQLAAGHGEQDPEPTDPDGEEAVDEAETADPDDPLLADDRPVDHATSRSASTRR
jgi:ParB family transcriptional regulator, chromosome partitioning protein